MGSTPGIAAAAECRDGKGEEEAKASEPRPRAPRPWVVYHVRPGRVAGAARGGNCVKPGGGFLPPAGAEAPGGPPPGRRAAPPRPPADPSPRRRSPRLGVLDRPGPGRD